MAARRASDAPTVSVCIPTLGRPALVERCLPGVLREVADGDEVVVAFHGADRMLHDPVLDDPRVRVVVAEGDTVSAVRNAAAAAATRACLAFLDDDDQWVPGALEQLRSMLVDPSAAFASGAVAVLGPDGAEVEVLVPKDQGGLYAHAVALFHSGSFVVRRAAFEQVGGYREQLAFGENYDLGMRLASALADQPGAIVHTTQVVLRWNRSETDYGSQPAVTAAFLLDTYPDLLERHRDERAKLHAICGVHAWRAAERRAARRHFRAAVADRPAAPEHWARLLTSLVSPVADRRWRGGR